MIDPALSAGSGDGATRQTASDPEMTTFDATPVTSRMLRFRLSIGGVRVDRMDAEEIMRIVGWQVGRGSERPVAIGSVNLDHIHHFGLRGERRGTIDHPDSRLEWLMLIDGSPVARHARTVTDVSWPRLAGSDLLPDLLSLAERIGARIGFLGGRPETVATLSAVLRSGWPELAVAGHWTPERSVIDDREGSNLLAAEIADAIVDILVVGLGKPRQEAWIERHGPATGASVLTAFGAAADFLAGSARRAPRWMRRAGIEWMFRLAREPHRLARRYLVEGPESLWVLRRTPTQLDYAEAVLPGSLRRVTSRRGAITTRSPSRRVLEP